MNIINILIKGKNLTDEEFGQVQANLKGIEKSALAAGGVLTGVGVALGASLAGATIFAANTEEQIKNALTLVDATGKEYEKMEEGMSSLATSLSRKLGIEAKNVAEGYYQVLSAGAAAGSKDFERMTETGLKLAKVVGLETSQSVELLADTINAYGGSLSEAERYADGFFTTSKLAATTVPQLGMAMRDAAPVAATFNQRFATTNAVLAGFASRGFKGALAGTSFRQIMVRLGAATGETATEIKKLNIEIFNEDKTVRNVIDILMDLQRATKDMGAEEKALALKTIAGEEAFSKLAAILDMDLELLKKWEEQLDETGSLQGGFEKKMEGFNEQWKLLKIEAQAIVEIIGRHLIPRGVQVAQMGREIAGSFADWLGQNKAVIDSITILTGVILGGGGLFVGIGLTIKAITSLAAIAAVAFSPAGALVAGVIGIGILFAKFQSDISKMKKQMEDLSAGDYSIKLETPELAKMGIRFSIPKDMGEKIITQIERSLERLRQLEPGDTFKSIEDGIEKIKTVRELIHELEDKKADIEVRVNLKTPEEQEKIEFVEALQKSIEALPRGSIQVPVSLGENREEVLDRLDKLLADMRKGIFQDPVEVPVEPTLKEIKQADIDKYIDTLKWKVSEAGKAAIAVDAVLKGTWTPEIKVDREGTKQWKEEITASVQETQIEVPDFEWITEDDIRETQQNINRVESILDAGLQKILDRENKWRDSFAAMFRQAASMAISEINKIIARWLVLTALKSLGSLFGGGLGAGTAGAGGLSLAPTPGLGGISITPAPMAQGGTMMFARGRALSFQRSGTLNRGLAGFDTVPAFVQPGETMVDRELTNRMRDFITAAEEGAFSGGGRPVNLNVGVYGGSDQEAQRLAHFISRNDQEYQEQEIAQGVD